MRVPHHGWLMKKPTRSEAVLPLSFYLKTGFWGALATTLLATATLAAMLLVVNSEGEPLYYQAIRAHSLTRHALGPALITAGVILVVIGSLTALFGTLYLSARVAGPLYRFRQNFQAAVSGGAIQGIRRNDYLQGASNHLQSSVATVREHRAGLIQLAAQAEESLNTLESAEELERIIRALQTEIARVRLD